MRRFLLVLALVFVPPSTAPQIPETNKRVSFTDGNELLGWCQTAQGTMKSNGESFEVLQSASTADGFDAGRCYGFIIGVAQTIPAGGAFSPGSTVRASQYLDVVVAYLKAHPNIRDKGASRLVSQALIEAFPNQKR